MKDVSFPSIEFLERMKTNRMRKLRLKQLLVLLLRTLIIVLIVLAFARPAINGVFQKNARTSAIIIIDGSASMEYVHNGELLSQHALRKAKEIVSMLGDGDRGAVILSSDRSEIIPPGLTDDKKLLIDSLDRLEYPPAGSDATGSFALAMQLLDTTRVPNREIYYLTDYAENTLPDSLPAQHRTVHIYTIPLGPETRGGAVIEKLELVDKLVTPGQPVTFRAGIHLDPDEDQTDIELFVNGERKGRTKAEKRAGLRTTTEFTFTPEAPGWYSIYAAIPDGSFEPGEIQRLVMSAPRKAKVLLIGPPARGRYFLKKALNPDTGKGMFIIEEAQAQDVTPNSLSGIDVVVLSGVTAVPESFYKSLVTAVVDRGIGLIVFPPAAMDESLYVNGIFRDLFPISVEKRITVNSTKGNFAVMDWFDIDHPILRGVSREGKFIKPEALSYYRMHPTGGEVTVFGRFNDESMAVGNTVCGKGRVVVFALDLSPEESELPLTGIFVPLFIRSVQYLSGTDILGGNYETGKTIHEYAGDSTGNPAISIKPENGPARLVEVAYSADGLNVKDEIAAEPGFYSVLVEGKERSRFCVNTPLSEIEFKRAGNTKKIETFKNITWKTLPDSGNLAEMVVKNRYGTELAGLFVVLSTLLLGLEMIISKKA